MSAGAGGQGRALRKPGLRRRAPGARGYLSGHRGMSAGGRGRRALTPPSSRAGPGARGGLATGAPRGRRSMPRRAGAAEAPDGARARPSDARPATAGDLLRAGTVTPFPVHALHYLDSISIGRSPAIGSRCITNCEIRVNSTFEFAAMQIARFR